MFICAKTQNFTKSRASLRTNADIMSFLIFEYVCANVLELKAGGYCIISFRQRARGFCLFGKRLFRCEKLQCP